MVPSDYVALARLPLTPNGKLDRRALPAPGDQRLNLEAMFVSPQAGLEQSIAAIWGEILGVKNPGADDNFFDLGGHSLLVVQVQSRLRQTLGVNVSVLKLFQYPTIRALSRHVSESKDEGGFLEKIRERGRRQRAAVRP
jgi:acyl carrier protein